MGLAQVEGFFGKAFIDPYLAYKLGNVLVSMRTGPLNPVDITDLPGCFFPHRVYQMIWDILEQDKVNIPDTDTRTQGFAIIFCHLLSMSHN